MSRPTALAAALIVLTTVVACSSSDQEGQLEWVAGLRPGDCVDPGHRAATEVVRMQVIRCDRPHSMEVYARLPYPPAAPASTPSPSTASYSPSMEIRLVCKQSNGASGYSTTLHYRSE